MDLAAALIKMIFLFNLILTCLGIFITSRGLKTNDIVPPDTQKIEEAEALVASFAAVSRILIITGIIIAVVSFFGCFGACVESPPFLSWYIFFVMLLIILQVCVGYYVHQTKGIDKDRARDIFWNTMKKYTADTRYKSFIDGAQSWLRCCGSKGVSDWVFLIKAPPPSCCDGNKDPCEVSRSFKKNCADAIDDLMKDFKSQHIWYISLVIGFQVILIIFTCYSRNVIIKRQEILF